MTGSSSKGDDNPCNEIVIKMDCSDYPEGVPYFKMDSSPATWTVNTTPRDKTLFSRAQLKNSTADFLSGGDTKNPIVKHIANVMGETATGLSSMKASEIKKLLQNLKNTNSTQAQALHHLLPVWLGGKNDGNLIPIDSDDHDKVHNWWNNKLKEKNDDFLDDIEKCTKRAANSGDKQKENAMERARKKKRGDGEINMNLNEINSTSLAANLKKAGIELKVEMDCPCAVPATQTNTI